jgi:hypothetical protein
MDAQLDWNPLGGADELERSLSCYRQDKLGWPGSACAMNEWFIRYSSLDDSSMTVYAVNTAGDPPWMGDLVSAYVSLTSQNYGIVI